MSSDLRESLLGDNNWSDSSETQHSHSDAEEQDPSNSNTSQVHVGEEHYSTRSLAAPSDQPLTCSQNTRKYIARILCVLALQNVLFPMRALLNLTGLAIEFGETLHNLTNDANTTEATPIPDSLVALSSLAILVPTFCSWSLNTLLSWSATAEKIAAKGLPLPQHRLGKATMILCCAIQAILPGLTFAALCASPFDAKALQPAPLNNITSGYQGISDLAYNITSATFQEGSVNNVLFGVALSGCSLMSITESYLVPYAYIMSMFRLFGVKLPKKDVTFLNKVLDSVHYSSKPFMRTLDKSIAVYTRETDETNTAQAQHLVDNQILNGINEQLFHLHTHRDVVLEVFARAIDICMIAILLGGFLTVCDFMEQFLSKKIGDAGLALSLLVNIATLNLIQVFTISNSRVYQTFARTLSGICSRSCSNQELNQHELQHTNKMFKTELCKVLLLLVAALTVFPDITNSNQVADAAGASSETKTNMAIITAVNTAIFNSSGIPRTWEAFLNFFKKPPCAKNTTNAKTTAIIKLPSEYASDDFGLAKQNSTTADEHAAKHHAIEGLTNLANLLVIGLAAASGITAPIKTGENSTSSGDVDHVGSLYQLPFISVWSILSTYARIFIRNHHFEHMPLGRNAIWSLFGLIGPIAGMLSIQYIASVASNAEYGTNSPNGTTGRVNEFTLAYVLSQTMLSFVIPGIAARGAPPSNKRRSSAVMPTSSSQRSRSSTVLLAATTPSSQ